MEQKIENLLNGKWYGIIVETGAGMPLYSELCDVPNCASKLIYYAYSPTSKNAFAERYNTESTRTVSKEACQKILDLETYGGDNDDVNFVFSDSIQIGNEAEIQTHGWIGYAIKVGGVWSKKYYHFSIDNFDMQMNRKELVQEIRKVCLDIFLSCNTESPTSCRIDMALYDDFSSILSPVLSQKLEFFNGIDTYVVIDGNGNFVRFNDALRCSKDNVIVFKGSFNPVHPEHIEMAYKALESIENSTIFFLISLSNFDASKKIDLDNLIRRVSMLNSFGFMVVINNYGRFFDTNLHFQTHPDFKGKKLYQLMGDDTLIRLINSETQKNLLNRFKDVEILTRLRVSDCIIHSTFAPINFLRVERGSTSSTDIRKWITDGDWNSIEKNFYSEYVKILKKFYLN